LTWSGLCITLNHRFSKVRLDPVHPRETMSAIFRDAPDE
jgi:hypothetical protein